MHKFTLGIDTGGTYTDAVIIDSTHHRIVASSKALTTRGDLAIGVGNALRAVLNDAQLENKNDISRVCISTTLATNALVEGQGSSVCAVLIGFDEGMRRRTRIEDAIPSASLISVAGGHRYNGDELAELDEDALREALSSEAADVEAFSVASLYSVRNPSHEQRAKTLIEELTGKPVTASHELSSELDGPKRALTATFNARIIALILGLEQAVTKSMQYTGLNASMMIVKSDGSIAPADAVVQRPIETILSGPAASVIGARFLSGCSDFVISDIGGTTSDVATVKNGWPKLNELGSDVGGFRTLVKAIDMRTLGLGGDSEVEVSTRGDVGLLSTRVVPMAMLAHEWPTLLDELKIALGETSGMFGAIQYVLLALGTDKTKWPKDLTPADIEFLNRIGEDRPRRIRDIVLNAADRSRLGRLRQRGLVQVSGLTPSDAAHILGQQSQWSVEGAWLAAELLGRACGKVAGSQPEDAIRRFAEEIKGEMVAKSTGLMIDQLTGQALADTNAFANAIQRQNGRLGDLHIKLEPQLDIVAVGGPAPVFYPEVGRRIGKPVVIPDNSDVANAIGAAIGMLKVRTKIEVTRREKGGYLVHLLEGPEIHEDPAHALERACLQARREAEQRSLSLGGINPEIEVKVERIDLPGLDASMSLVSAEITAEVVSTPG